MTTATLAQDLIGVTGRLVALMTTEIERLRARRPREIAPLQEEKAALVRAYEALVGELVKRPDALAAIAPESRAELAERTRAFHRVIVQNEASLRAAKEVNARIIQVVADAVAESRNGKPGYSESGSPARGADGRGGKVGPVTLDRTL